MSWPVLSGCVWEWVVCVCVRGQHTRADQTRADAGNEKGSGHIPETGDTQQAHVGGPLKSRWGRAGDRGAGVQALVPASHAPRSPSLIALIIWNGARLDGNGDLHASPGNGVCLAAPLCACVRIRRLQLPNYGVLAKPPARSMATQLCTLSFSLGLEVCVCLVDACRFQVLCMRHQGIPGCTAVFWRWA